MDFEKKEKNVTKKNLINFLFNTSLKIPYPYY